MNYVNHKKVKEEMCNTMNWYYKYISIPKSSFCKINTLILPIGTEEKYLNIPYTLPSFTTTSHYESNFPYQKIKKFNDVM